ncbi:MAG: hypothetical protein O9318_05200 [Hylemonella sp.]|uniref:hypothetical protein n=1 Tax=Hylemonella sp. TaxID=2066020 RepID=UPI0022C806DE|nr:hypothetical protein [Hylemonella sp.]MCZ8251847.1 hypothetical protein [Hylemonella sp.]
MNSAWSATYTLWSPLHKLLRRLTTPAAPRTTGASSVLPCHNTTAAIVRSNRPVPRPLRVVRVMEAGQPRSQVGRMVISGRMADVCAELDRLAACEAA